MQGYTYVITSMQVGRKGREKGRALLGPVVSWMSDDKWSHAQEGFPEDLQASMRIRGSAHVPMGEP